MKNSRKEIQYPQQTGAYKLCVLDRAIWQEYSHARLQISIGNPKHSGEKFFALAEWAEARFEHVTVIVSDTLQRHNLVLFSNINFEDATALSLKNGDDWINENKAALDLLPRKTISRWDEWLNHLDFSKTYQRICEIVLNDEYINSLVEEKVKLFSRGKSQNLNETFSQGMFKAARAYILEELAIFAIMLREGRAIDIYPGTWFKELFLALSKYSQEELMEGFPNAAYIKVDFVKNKFAQNRLGISGLG